jgi:hypothetical protein
MRRIRRKKLSPGKYRIESQQAHAMTKSATGNPRESRAHLLSYRYSSTCTAGGLAAAGQASEARPNRAQSARSIGANE